LQRERVNESELEAAQDYAVGHFPLTIETPDQLATQVLNQLFYELSVEDLPKYRERVLKVSPEDIQRVARWFVRPDQLSVVLVGNADQFVDTLKGAGFATFERIPMDRLDILAADMKKQ
jgi:zinc protease